MASDALVRLTMDNSDFDSKLVKSKNKLRDFGSSANSTSSTVGSFGGSLGSVAGVVGKFAGAIGVAYGAASTFKSIIESSEASHDAYATSMRACSDVVDTFFASINNGSFGSFFDGLDGVIERAVAAYQALDDLGSFSSRYNPWSNAINSKIDSLVAQSRAKKAQGDIMGAIGDLWEAKRLAKELKATNTNLGSKRENAAYLSINELFAKQNSGITITNDFIKYFANPSNWEKTNKMADAYKKKMEEIKQLEIKANKKASNGTKMGREEAGDIRLVIESMKKEQSFINNKAAYVFQNLRDDIESDNGKQFNQALSDLYGGIQAEAQNLSVDAKIERALARTTQTSAKRKTPSKTPKISKPEEQITPDSIADFENKIKELRKQLNQAVDNSTYNGIQSKIDELKGYIDYIQKGTKFSGLSGDNGFVNVGPTLPNGIGLDAQIQKLRGKPANLNLPSNEKQKKPSAIEGMDQMLGGITSMTSDLKNLGIELPNGLTDVLGGMQSICSILMTINTILTAIEAISTADAILPFARGGVVHASNGIVAGSNYVDRVPATLTSGEMVINSAQQSALWKAISSGNYGGGGGSSTISGEQIVTVINAYGRRTRKGEILR